MKTDQLMAPVVFLYFVLRSSICKPSLRYGYIAMVGVLALNVQHQPTGQRDNL